MRPGLARLKINNNRNLGMKRSVCVYTIALLSLCSFVTYADDGGLWGDIDKPASTADTGAAAAPSAPVTVPSAPGYGAPASYTNPATAPIKPEDVNSLITVKTPEDQKTVCDTLNQQPVLTPDAINNLKAQNIPANFKAALDNPTSANAIYQQFRQQYLQTKCVGVPSTPAPATTTAPPAAATPSPKPGYMGALPPVSTPSTTGR
jgi:hypothetical protein